MYDVRAMPRLEFPAGFFWGSSTSAYQIEGGAENTDWHRAWQQGRVKEPCGRACDHWNRWREDVGLIRDLGHQVYRFSIEWARVEPDEGCFDESAIQHYVDLCRNLREAGVRPWVTFFHFVNPIWFADKGEWNKEENIGCFLRFVERMVPLLAPYVDGWAPINEYNFYSGAPNQPEDFRRLANYTFNLLIADAACYDIAKVHSPAPCASPMAYLALQPRRAHDVFDRTMTDFADWCANGWYYHAIRTGELVYPFHDGRWLPSVKGRADHWAVNMYARDMVDARAKHARGPRYQHRALRINASHRDNAWEFSPDELLHNMMRLKDKPVVITENGCNSEDDRFRIVSIALHLAMAREAIDQGLDLRGYLHWSLFDNYEWGNWAPKYGLVGFDPTTFERTPKPSALFLRDVIRENAISGEIVRRHLDRHPSMADDVAPVPVINPQAASRR